jgi:hypothetical protein
MLHRFGPDFFSALIKKYFFIVTEKKILKCGQTISNYVSNPNHCFQKNFVYDLD